MLLRYGFYEGQVDPARQEEFDRHFQETVIPGLAEMPGLVHVRLLRGVAVPGIEPRFHHIIELTFADEEGLVRAMNSEERRALQAANWSVMAAYRGATPHANFLVTASLEGPDAHRSP
jgi:uncharacterized protein (TIGR02118 family)